MKKIKVLLIVFLAVFAFIPSACEKDHGETPYEDVNDNDWKKKLPLTSDCDIHELKNVQHTMTK